MCAWKGLIFMILCMPYYISRKLKHKQVLYSGLICRHNHDNKITFSKAKTFWDTEIGVRDRGT